MNNLERSRIYVERARNVLDKVFTDKAYRLEAVKDDKIRRSFISKEIGCQPATPYQSIELRDLLKKADNKLMLEHYTAAGERPNLRNRLRRLEEVVEELQLRISLQEQVIDNFVSSRDRRD